MALSQFTVPDNILDALGKLSASAILGVICWWLIRRDGESRRELQAQSKEYIKALENVVAENTKAINGVKDTVETWNEKLSRSGG